MVKNDLWFINKKLKIHTYTFIYFLQDLKPKLQECQGLFFYKKSLAIMIW